MPEVYNVRDRSFIKKPETQVCITCGQNIAPEVKPMNNHMNRYVNDISGNTVVLNSNEDYVEVQGVKLRREDVDKKVEAPTPAPKVVNTTSK